jgi:Xaa-Pro aminopeptidase
MHREILKEKISQAVDILNEKNIDVWLIFVRETENITDPVLEIIAGMNVIWPAAFIISKDGDTTLIVGGMELDTAKTIGAYQNIIGYSKSIRDELLSYLKKKSPKKIAINFSKNSDVADGLTHGMYLLLLDYIKGSSYENSMVSSEEIIAALKGRKSPAEISIMKEAVKETLKIIKKVSRFINPGKTELEVSAFVKNIVKENGFGFAWEEDHCPAVFTGPNAGGAHSGPTNRLIERGHLVNIDFGINFKGYCSDLQRTWYVLKEDESNPPEEVKRGFNVIKDSIQLAAENLKPGIMGCEIDDVVRNYIIQNGYEEYPHGTGHQVGRKTHDGGTGLAPRWERYGTAPYMKVEENQIFTIEPRLKIEGFGTATIEEEVIITKTGCEFLSDPQKEIWLIK